MSHELVDQAIALLEKANAGLQPELLEASSAWRLMGLYARVAKLAGFGIAALARKVSDAGTVAQVTGTSVGKAKGVVTTGKVLGESPELAGALQSGALSLDQASEIASAEESSPGAASQLVKVAESEPFHVLKDKARAVKLEAEQHKDLARRQHDARTARTYTDALGMVHLDAVWEPHIGVPLVARAEAEAERIATEAKKRGDDKEPFERYLADAFARLLSGGGKGRARRPELVVLVSHEVAKRGWKDVRPGEVCKIPGVGPVSPQVAKEIASDAFLNGVFYDGCDLRHFKRWGRGIPVELTVALELGAGPQFEGVRCVDCGRRFKTQLDHVEPVAAQGPTSLANNKYRCWQCHQEKTKRDMEALRKRKRAESRHGPAARAERNGQLSARPTNASASALRRSMVTITQRITAAGRPPRAAPASKVARLPTTGPPQRGAPAASAALPTTGFP